MQMVRIQIQLPRELKRRLDAERSQGTTASGLIRHLVEEHFRQPKPPKRRRSH